MSTLPMMAIRKTGRNEDRQRLPVALVTLWNVTLQHEGAQTTDVQKLGHFNFNTKIDGLLHSHKVTVEALQRKTLVMKPSQHLVVLPSVQSA